MLVYGRENMNFWGKISYLVQAEGPGPQPANPNSNPWVNANPNPKSNPNPNLLCLFRATAFKKQIPADF